MATTVGDVIVKRLSEWRVNRIYGYPGDGIAGVTAALRKAGNEPRFIQARHEELAAFMACAHAKFTGEVGVCLATSGPGAIHLLNGLYDAKMDHQPVVAIVGQAATTALGSQYQQEVDLHNLFKDVASEFITTVSSPGAAPRDRPRAAHRDGPAHRHLRDSPEGRAGGIGRRAAAPGARLRLLRNWPGARHAARRAAGRRPPAGRDAGE
ncbi:MAG: thiamine pyrophosphate-binding protein [Tepidisphaeraceae bacterium]